MLTQLQRELERLAVASRGVLPLKGAWPAALAGNVAAPRAGESFLILDSAAGGALYIQLSERPRYRVALAVTGESA